MNNVFLTGRLTKDIEVKQTASGTAYTRFSIAVDKYKNKEKTTIFVDCVAFGHNANYLGKYVSKGNKIVVNGELDCTTKEKDDGSKITYWNVIANSVEAVGKTENKASDDEEDMPFEV